MSLKYAKINTPVTKTQDNNKQWHTQLKEQHPLWFILKQGMTADCILLENAVWRLLNKTPGRQWYLFCFILSVSFYLAQMNEHTDPGQSLLTEWRVKGNYRTTGITRNLIPSQNNLTWFYDEESRGRCVSSWRIADNLEQSVHRAAPPPKLQQSRS